MTRMGLSLAACLLAAGCLNTVIDEPLPPPPPGTLRGGDEVRSRLVVDRERHEITLFMGPFDVPTSMTTDGHGHGHGHGGEGGDARSPLFPFVWPVDAGFQEVRMALHGPDGAEYPREITHHLIGVNFDRRQLVYPVIERTFGFGTETKGIRLPDFLEVDVQRGDTLGVWVMWNNDTGEDLEDLVLQVAFRYAAPGRDREVVFPIYMDAHNEIGTGTSFDVPPGESTWSYEFDLPVSGGLLGTSGHLHDYGTELRLEDVETGRVLFTLEPEVDREGRVTGVERRIFRRFFNLFDARIPLEAGVRYRVVGVYDNPTGEAITDGGMAHIVGIFAPDDPDAWPAIDRSSAIYRVDRGHLPPIMSVARH